MHPLPQRDEIVLCRFPFSENPNKPGPHPHFGLVVETFKHKGLVWVVVAYGTSKADASLQAKHSVILDVRQESVTGLQLERQVTHFLCDRLAVLPWDPRWFKQDLRGTLILSTVTPAEKQFMSDLTAAHRAMDKNAVSALRHWVKTEKPGLISGSDLR